MKSKEFGQSLVEFALILPILMLLLLGIFEGGRIIQGYISAQNASREAARYAVSGQPLTEDPDNPGPANAVPWAEPDDVRVEAIKNVAIDASWGTGYTQIFSTTSSYDSCQTGSDSSCAGVLGIGVWSRMPDGSGGLTDFGANRDHPGIQGLDVRVDVYHNVQLLDPIYAAIAPGGFVRVRASTVMKNEGVDISIKGTPLALTGPESDPEQGGGDPPTTDPTILFQEGNEVEVGQMVTIKLTNHAKDETYHIYFAGAFVTTVTTDGSGNAIHLGYIIPPLAPGGYKLNSIKDGETSDTAQRQITVKLSENADIVVNEDTPSDIWPLGSPLTYRLINHAPNIPSPPGIQVYLDGAPLAGGNLETDAAGNTPTDQAGQYDIPQSAAAGTHTFTTTAPASRTVNFVVGCIKIDQGGCNSSPVTFPKETPLYIHLENHAYNHEYSLRFIDPNGSFSEIINPTVQTGSDGKAFNIFYTLPDAPNTGAGDPYRIETYDGTNRIASKDVIIDTPDDPFIIVEGGYKWAAGSNIRLHLKKHEPGIRYDLYWDGVKVFTNTTFPTDANGESDALDYDIPVDTTTGSYQLTTRPNPADAAGHPTSIYDPDYGQALNPIEVTGIPYIQIVEGNPQIPGSTITLRLVQHNINTEYDLYIIVNSVGIKLPGNPVGTDTNGEGSLEYLIPTNLNPGTDYLIRSYPKGNTSDVTAETTLQLAAPDLQVTSIVAPTAPAFNVPFPITLTVKNVSGVTITHSSLDVDIYLDPPEIPEWGKALPPGDIKLWLQPPIAMNETRTITTQVILYGSFDHTIWGRVDTSNRVIETDESNNLRSIPVSPAGCQIELTASALQNSIAFGDADNSSSSISGETITLHNNGTGAANTDDNTGGYFYLYHQISGNFDVRVRTVSQDPDELGSFASYPFANYGLEIRQSLAPDGSPYAPAKLQWVRSYGNRLLYLERQNGSINSDVGLGPSTTNPIWLRIVKSGAQFTLYYAPNSASPPTSWTPVQTLAIPALEGDVYLGVMNTSTSSLRDRVTLDGYHVCGNPGGSCGAVREAGGLTVINANNYVENIAVNDLIGDNGSNYGTMKWEATTNGGKIGMVVPNQGARVGGDRYVTDSPQLRYEADFSTTGPHYVWFLGLKPGNSGNSLHFGPTNSPAPGAKYWNHNGSNNVLQWFNQRNNPNATYGIFIDINQVGTNSLSVWMREDGFELYQILLTTNPAYDPRTASDPLDIKQSQCADAGIPPAPPGLQQCEDVIVNGRFEEDSLMSVWNYSSIGEQVTRTSVPHWLQAGESFSMLLPDTSIGGVARSPWLWQAFQMPTWIITPTVNAGGQLNLKAHVGVNPEGAPEPDELFVSLLDATGSLTVTNPISMVTGADTPTINPSAPDNNDWIFKQIDLADFFTPPESLLNYRGQDLQLYFSAPNEGTDSTRFYLDNVALDICSIQPIPLTFNTKVAGDIRVLIEGVPTPKPGIFVWIYAIDGQMQKSYTIQDSTFSFYDLPATPSGTVYILYAEYLGETRFYSASTILLLKQGQSIDDISLLLF